MSQDERRTLMLEYRFPLRPDEPKKNPYLCRTTRGEDAPMSQDDIETVRESLTLMFEIDEEEQAAGYAALDRLEARLHAAEELSQNTGRELNRVEAELIAAEEENGQLREQVGAINEQRRSLEAELDRLREARCPTCDATDPRDNLLGIHEANPDDEFPMEQEEFCPDPFHSSTQEESS